VKRYAKVVGLREDQIEEYKRIHREVWPEVLRTIRDCNIRNYSIFLRRMPDGRWYLFSYYEYVGDDHEADMAKMARCPKTQEWWKITDPMQFGLENRAPGEWWAECEEVFHTD